MMQMHADGPMLTSQLCATQKKGRGALGRAACSREACSRSSEESPGMSERAAREIL